MAVKYFTKKEALAYAELANRIPEHVFVSVSGLDSDTCLYMLNSDFFGCHYDCCAVEHEYFAPVRLRSTCPALRTMFVDEWVREAERDKAELGLPF